MFTGTSAKQELKVTSKHGKMGRKARLAHLDSLILDLIEVSGLDIGGNAVQLVLQGLVGGSNDRLGAEVHSVGAPAKQCSSTLHVVIAAAALQLD